MDPNKREFGVPVYSLVSGREGLSFGDLTIALNGGARFLAWLQVMLHELNVGFEKPQVFCDNHPAIR